MSSIFDYDVVKALEGLGPVCSEFEAECRVVSSRHAHVNLECLRSDLLARGFTRLTTADPTGQAVNVLVWPGVSVDWAIEYVATSEAFK